MDPYEARPDKVPEDDRYADVPFYGRYHPQPDDFSPDPQHTLSSSADSLAYWASVIRRRCDETTRIYENEDGGRDVFAVGGVIVKSSHLHDRPAGRRADRDFSYADKNELAATALARDVLLSCHVQVPAIYFAGKIDGRNVLVQERIPGVGLNVAWQYLSAAQKKSFKEQARAVLGELSKVHPPPGHPAHQDYPTRRRSYVYDDPDPVQHKGIQDLEHELLFSGQNTDADADLSLMHNDFTKSNCIVDQDKIVGLVDWEMAGYFGWKTAGAVHEAIRCPKRENYAALDLPEDLLADILSWNDLYNP